MIIVNLLSISQNSLRVRHNITSHDIRKINRNKNEDEVEDEDIKAMAMGKKQFRQPSVPTITSSLGLVYEPFTFK